MSKRLRNVAVLIFVFASNAFADGQGVAVEKQGCVEPAAPVPVGPSGVDEMDCAISVDTVEPTSGFRAKRSNVTVGARFKKGQVADPTVGLTIAPGLCLKAGVVNFDGRASLALQVYQQEQSGQKHVLADGNVYQVVEGARLTPSQLTLRNPEVATFGGDPSLEVLNRLPQGLHFLQAQLICW